MAHVYDRIDERLRAWIARQPLFFVGTAPRADDGHVNVSPKGPIGTLRVLDDRTLAYLDVVGSGAETIAHLRENGRIVVMLCAFEGPPRILRLHGRGVVSLPGEPEFARLLEQAAFEQPAAPEARRAVIVVARRAHRGLVRLRSAADGLRGQPPASGRVGGEAAARRRRRRARRLPGREERRQHRRAARDRRLSSAARRAGLG